MANEDLGKKFIRGGVEELEELIEIYGKKLLRYAIAILCDYHEAENVVQEVFISAYQSRDSFDGENISAWLYKITYNSCLNKLKRRKLLYLPEIRGEELVVEKDTGLSDEALKALGKLKAKDRALVYGRVIEELSYRDLSNLMGKSEAALRKQYERAKKKLARLLTIEYKRRETKHEKI